MSEVSRSREGRASSRFDNGLRYRDPHDPSQVQLTPEYVLSPVREDLGGVIGLDPCTTLENPCAATRFCAPPEDGLARSWECEGIYCNPPYGKAREPWVERCIEAGERGFAVILLIPAATDTRIFQRAVSTSSAVVFVRGRVKFGVLRPNRRQAAASHPSALIGWKTSLRACSSLGIRVFEDSR